MAGDRGPHRCRLRHEGECPRLRRGSRAAGHGVLLHPVLLPRSTPRGPRTAVFHAVLVSGRARPAPEGAARRPDGSRTGSLHRSGEEDLGDIQRGDAALRHSEQPQPASRGAERHACGVGARRSRRCGRLATRSHADGRAAAAPRAPVRAGPPRPGRGGCAREVARGAARRHPGRRHPPGPEGADRGGERPRGRASAAARRVDRRGRRPTPSSPGTPPPCAGCWRAPCRPSAGFPTRVR